MMTRRSGTRRPLVLALTAALLIGTGSAAWGYWTSAATATATATTTTVSVSQAGFTAVGATYRNHELVSTGGFTVTNTGQTAGSVTLALAASSGAAFGAAMPISVWQVAAPANCTAAATVPGGAVTGTWASWSQTTPVPLAAGASGHFCVRTVLPSRQAAATASGMQTSAATLTVALDDAVGWVGTVSATGSATRTTELIYPFARVSGIPTDSPNYIRPGLSNWFTFQSPGTSLCLDVSASGGSGTRAITWTCHQDANQRWEILPDATNPALVQLRPKHQDGLGTRLTVTGSAVTIATANNSASQLWEIQRIGDNAFQVVAHSTGQCLTMATASADVQLVTAPCAPAARGTQVLSLTREPLTVTITTATNPVVTFGFAAVPGTTYHLQRWTGSAWASVATGTGTTLAVTTSQTTVPRNVTTEYRIIVNGTTNVVYSGIKLTRDGGNVITAAGGFG